MSYYPSPPSIPTRKATSVKPPFSQQTEPQGNYSQGYGVQAPAGSVSQGYGNQGSGYGVTAPAGQPTGQGYGYQSSGYGVTAPAGPQTSGYGVQPPAGQPTGQGYGSQSSGYGVQPTGPSGYGAQAASVPTRGLNTQTSGYGAQPTNPNNQSSGYGVQAPSSFPSAGYGNQGPHNQPPTSQGYPGQSTSYGVQAPTGAMNQPIGMQSVTAGKVQPPQQDWFSQSGFASAIGAAAMTAMSGNQAAMTQMVAGAFDAEKQKSLTWVQTQTAVFKEYFNVTHAYVRWKLLFVLFPFVQSSAKIVTRTVSRDFPQSTEETDEQTGQGYGIGLRLFPGRKPDLYIPGMGFITFVLMHSLWRWEDFHPDDLYNIASLGVLLGFVEVLVLKGASYVLNVAHWSLIDLIAVCGYKFANLSLTVVLLIFLSFGGRAVWLGLYVFAAAMAGLTVHRGLTAVSSYNANSQHFMGTHSTNMERLVAIVAGGAQFLWIWILMPALKVGIVTVNATGGNIRQVVESTNS
jgi:hypothetical protein